MKHARNRRNDLPQRIEAATVAGRVPPHDLDAEAAVLSAVLLSAESMDRMGGVLKAEHFYSEANGRIFHAAVELHGNKIPVDVVSVASWLRDRDRLAQIGGPAYLAQLADATPAVAHVAAHAQIVYEKWRVRQLIATCQRVAAEGYGDVGSVQEFIDGAEQAVYDLSHAGNKAANDYQAVGPVLQVVFQELAAAADRGDRISGISTGYERLDDKLAGLHDGDLTIVAARPGQGKTSLVMNLATNIASPREEQRYHGEAPVLMPGYGAAVFSLEMPRSQLATRMMCSEAKVDLGRLRKGMLQQDDWSRMAEAGRVLAPLPIWIDDTPGLTLLDLRAKLRRMQGECGKPNAHGVIIERIGLVVVDYLQLMKGRDGLSSREQEISEISRGLKEVAKEFKVPVIALSQLNRAVEQRPDKKPQLSDLRESGAIEQDADNIIFIVRKEYYLEQECPQDWRGVAEIDVAKQRNGPTGSVLLKFTRSCTRFDTLPRDHYPSDFEES